MKKRKKIYWWLGHVMLKCWLGCLIGKIDFQGKSWWIATFYSFFHWEAAFKVYTLPWSEQGRGGTLLVILSVFNILSLSRNNWRKTEKIDYFQLNIFIFISSQLANHFLFWFCYDSLLPVFLAFKHNHPVFLIFFRFLSRNGWIRFFSILYWLMLTHCNR